MRELTAGMYELIDEIAPGGAGAAHEVRDTRGDSLVRVRLGSDRCVVGPDVERRVEQACRLQHDHIVPVLGLARRGSGQYVVEEPVEGERLDVLLEERRALSPVEALSIVRQLADALVYAHEHGVVHGCVSPAAVVIQDAARPRAMLAGFGSTGIILPYVAPERLKGDELEPRADVFALGLVLFEMLEGRPFFASADEQELRALLLEQTGPLLPQFSSILPPGLSALVARMIRRKAATRSSMVRVRSEIEACLPRRTAAPVTRVPKAAAPAPPTPAVSTPAEPKKRVVVRMPSPEAEDAAPERPAPATVVAPRVLVRTGVAPRRTPIAGVALIAAVLVALGWPLVRAVVRAAPHRATMPEAAAAAAVAAVPAAAEQSVPPPVLVAEAAAPAPGEPEVPAETALASAAPQDGSPAAVGGSAATGIRPPPNTAPQIVGYQPRRRDGLSVMEGGPVDFSVRATDQDLNETVSYAWFLDGRRVSQRPSWRFVAPLAGLATSHTVEARASDGGGLQAPRLTWHVEVTPRMTDVNVRDWLGRLAGAWERRDVSTLRLYGVVTSDAEASALRKRLAHADGGRVMIGNETIRLQGRFARVAVNRTELDRHGRVLASQRESYELEKQPNGFIGLRPAAVSAR